jgi:hypothetical protein
VLAVLGVILAAVAGLLKLLHSHPSWVIPLLIVAVILIGAEVAWGWHRGGMYRRPQ